MHERKDPPKFPVELPPKDPQNNPVLPEVNYINGLYLGVQTMIVQRGMSDKDNMTGDDSKEIETQEFTMCWPEEVKANGSVDCQFQCLHFLT